MGKANQRDGTWFHKLFQENGCQICESDGGPERICHSAIQYCDDAKQNYFNEYDEQSNVLADDLQLAVRLFARVVADPGYGGDTGEEP